MTEHIRVAVTGFGILSALGRGTDENTDKMQAIMDACGCKANYHKVWVNGKLVRVIAKC